MKVSDTITPLVEETIKQIHPNMNEAALRHILMILAVDLYEEVYKVASEEFVQTLNDVISINEKLQ